MLIFAVKVHIVLEVRLSLLHYVFSGGEVKIANNDAIVRIVVVINVVVIEEIHFCLYKQQKVSSVLVINDLL